MTRRHTRQWTAIWLGCAAALLLGLAAAFLSHLHSTQMQELRDQAAQTRARLMAQSIGQRMADATAAGIPLQQLVGVKEFLARWHKTHPDVTYIAIHDRDGQQLWRSTDNVASTNSRLSAGNAYIAPAGLVQAQVRLQLQSGNLQRPGQLLALLAPAVLMVSALAYLGALFACAQGPWLRNHGMRLIGRWAIRGDYRRWLALPQRRSFDLRVQEVAHAMYSAHERMVRMRLLIGSLRRTEPQQQRRDYLDQVLQQTEGSDRFPESTPGTLRLVAVQAQSLWMALLLCLGAVSPMTYALRLHGSAAAGPGLQQVLPAACLGLLMLAAALGSKLFARLQIATLSVLILSLAALLLAPLLLLLDSGLHPGWIAAWNGCFAGAALTACTRAQTHPDSHPGFAHVQPEIPGAASLGWWAGLLWLAPALGFYAHTALRPSWALATLLLPVLCGLFCATRWDAAHSPWRARMATAPAPRPADRAPDRALGLAAGLVAAPMLQALATSSAPDHPALLQQCALGIGLASVWLAGRQTGASVPRRWSSVALLAVAIQLAVLWVQATPYTPPWLGPIASFPPVLLGLLLAQGLADAARSQPAATSLQQLLLCSGIGAVLGTLAFVLGLAGWPLVLAAALLARLPSAWMKGSHVS